MKIFTTTILVFFTITVFSQNTEHIDNLINNLSWNSITCDHSHDLFILNYQDTSVKELINIGKPAIKNLLKHIENSEKTVIIHIILTKCIEPNNSNDGYLSMKYMYKNCDQLIGWHYIFNGLIWEYIDEVDSISQQEIKKIKNYWTDRIEGKIKERKDNIEDIFRELEKSDFIKYPCNKIYQNNSKQLSEEEK